MKIKSTDVEKTHNPSSQKPHIRLLANTINSISSNATFALRYGGFACPTYENDIEHHRIDPLNEKSDALYYKVL